MSILNISTIKARLKEYSLQSVLNMVYGHYRLIMPILLKNDINTLKNQILPFELDKIVMMAVLWCEESNKEVTKKFFYDLVETIRNNQPVKLKNYSKTQYIEYMLPSLKGNQIKYQIFFPQVIKRYYDFFSYSDKMFDFGQEIRAKIGIEWKRLLGMCCYIINTTMNSKDVFLIEQCNKTFQEEVDCLSIDIELLRSQIQSLCKNDEDIFSCFCPLVQYPFIKFEGNLLFPLIFELIPACTSSLIFRLTEDNDDLRKNVGKVYERYLFETLLNSDIFEIVLPEQKYKTINGERKSLDVLCKLNDYYYLFDSKSYYSKISDLIYDNNSIDKDIDRLSECVQQVYIHIHNKFGDEYNIDSSSVDKNHVFGCVVIPEEVTQFTESVFKIAAKKLSIPFASREYEWLCTHVCIASIATIEEHCILKQWDVPISHDNQWLKRLTISSEDLNIERILQDLSLYI